MISMLIAATMMSSLPGRTGKSHDAAIFESRVIAELSQLFVNACMNGELRLRPGAVRLARKNEVGAADRGETFTEYRIQDPAKGVLRISQYSPATRDGWIRSCDLSASIFSIRTAWDVVSYAALGHNRAPFAQNCDYYTIDNPAEHYEIFVSRGGLTVATYTDEEATKRIKANGTREPVQRARDLNLQ